MIQLRSPRCCAISAVFFLIGVLGCDAQRSSTNSTTELKLLSTAELQTMIPGNTLSAVASAETAWAVYYDTNGVEYGTYGEESDKGRWRISDEMLCSDWDTWGDGERCFKLHQNNVDEVLGYDEAVHEWTALVEPGDSRQLKQ